MPQVLTAKDRRVPYPFSTDIKSWKEVKVNALNSAKTTCYSAGPQAFQVIKEQPFRCMSRLYEILMQSGSH